MELKNRPGVVVELHPGRCQKHTQRERDRSIRLRMNKFWNGGEKILGSGEGEVKSRRPRERFPRPFKSINEDSCCTLKKLPVEIDHS